MNENVYPYTATAAFLTWKMPSEDDKLRAWHDGRCAMCGHTDRLVEDHDHATGLTRGLLCRSCNFSESNSPHAAFVAWRSGMNPCHLFGWAEEYVPLFGRDLPPATEAERVAAVEAASVLQRSEAS